MIHVSIAYLLLFFSCSQFPNFELLPGSNQFAIEAVVIGETKIPSKSI